MNKNDQPEPVLLRIKRAAALVDLSPDGLRKLLQRYPPPAGVLVKKGKSVWLVREAFLAWMQAEGTA